MTLSTEIKYQTLGWQTHEFAVTDGGPVTGVADQITVLVDGIAVAQSVTETDVAGTYKIGFEPFEIKDKATINLTYTAPGTSTANPETITLTDPATLSTFSQYCTIYDVYTRFGYDNVNKWADLGNQRSLDAIVTKIIDEIATASEEGVNDGLRGRRYTIPLSAPYPKSITNLTRLAAGVAIHGSRGIEDDDPSIDLAKKESTTLLQNIAAGVLRLNLDTSITHGSYENVTTS